MERNNKRRYDDGARYTQAQRVRYDEARYSSQNQSRSLEKCCIKLEQLSPPSVGLPKVIPSTLALPKTIGQISARTTQADINHFSIKFDRKGHLHFYYVEISKVFTGRRAKGKSNRFAGGDDCKPNEKNRYQKKDEKSSCDAENINTCSDTKAASENQTVGNGAFDLESKNKMEGQASAQRSESSLIDQKSKDETAIGELSPCSDDPSDESLRRKERRLGMKISREIFGKLNKDLLEDCAFVFDGRHMACGVKRLKEDTIETVVIHHDEEWKVSLKYAKTVSLSSIGESRDLSNYSPEEVLMGLAVIFNNSPSINLTPVGRGFYGLPNEYPVPVPGGFELWKGFKQSVIPVESGVHLNINYSVSTFVKAGYVKDLICELINSRDNRPPSSLSPQQCRILSDKLKKCTAQTLHTKKNIVIQSVTKESADRITFTSRDGRRISVAEYFDEAYPKFSLRYPRWPCAVVGNQRRVYYPLEVIKLGRGNPYTGDNTPTAQIITKAAIPPQKRFEEIKKVLKMVKSDNALKEFGIETQNHMSLRVRTLPLPSLEAWAGSSISVRPGVIDFKKSSFAKGARIRNWTIFNTSERISQDSLFDFVSMLSRQGEEYGMDIGKPLLDRGQFPYVNGNPRDLLQFEKDIEYLIEKYKLDFVMFALGDNSTVHASLKYVCDVKLGVSCKCIRGQTLFNISKNSRTWRNEDQRVLNILYGLNTKFDGINVQGIRDEFAFNLLTSTPTLVIGIDVNHGRGRPGGSKRASLPSTVGIVGTRNISATLYTAFMKAQIKPINSDDKEIVQEDILAAAFKEILLAFCSSTKRKPQRIFVFRDGVSVGQFEKVLSVETQTMINVCSTLPDEDGNPYRPPITVVTVQKRHNTRIFPQDIDYDHRGKSKENAIAGTVVDHTITSPNMCNYFLVSHEGIMGTCRPAHYTVLLDENNFTMDQLQSFSYYMCHMYAKCPRSVSIPAPIYYAHWTALRASEIARCKLTQQVDDFDSFDGCLENIEETEKKYLSIFNDSLKMSTSCAKLMYFL